MIRTSSSGTSIVWVCDCGARDLALTESGLVDQVEAHLVSHVPADDPGLKRAAETIARYGRRHGL